MLITTYIKKIITIKVEIIFTILDIYINFKTTIESIIRTYR